MAARLPLCCGRRLQGAGCRPPPATGSNALAGSPRSADEGTQALLERAHRGQDRGRLIAAVGHAVVAARVLTTAEVVPVRVLQEFLPRLGVAVVEQVAG